MCQHSNWVTSILVVLHCYHSSSSSGSAWLKDDHGLGRTVQGTKLYCIKFMDPLGLDPMLPCIQKKSPTRPESEVFSNWILVCSVQVVAYLTLRYSVFSETQFEERRR